MFQKRYFERKNVFALIRDWEEVRNDNGEPGFGAFYCFTLILPPVIGKVIMTAFVVLGYT